MRNVIQAAKGGFLVFLWVLTGVFAHAQTVPTVTELLLAPDSAGGTLNALATVTAAGVPVTAGQVVFSINGKDATPTQVVGVDDAHVNPVGTAKLCQQLPSGSYKVTARYLGTSTWGMSAAAASTLTLHGYIGATLSLSGPDTTGYAFSLSAREQLGLTMGNVSLRDLTAASIIGTSPLAAGPSVSTTEFEILLGFKPSAFALGDLTGHGTQDIVVTNAEQSEIVVYLEQSDGTYLLASKQTVGSHPTSILIKDFDGDGLADIAVIDSGDQMLSILKQSPTHPGVFGPAVNVPIGNGAIAITSADVNNDGLPDLLVANFSDDTISILLNQASAPGSFQSRGTLATQNGPSAIAVGDFLGEGHSDLAVTNYYDGTVSIFASKPTSAALFSSQKTVFRVGSGPVAITVADFNGDGLPDLAVCNALDGTVSILPGLVSFPGQYPKQLVIQGFVQPNAVVALDTTASTEPIDLAVADSFTGALTTLHNDGSGTFLTRSVLVLGQGLSSVLPIHRFGSGAFEVAALDPALASIHRVQANWVVSGKLSGETLPSQKVHTLQAAYIPTGSISVAVLSNTLATTPSPLQLQTISFEPLAPVVYGIQPVTLKATSSSGLPIEFSIRAGKATLNGAVLSVHAAGLILIQADQPGNAEFSAATSVQRYLYVAKAQLVIAPAASTRIFGTRTLSLSGTITGLVGVDSIHVDYSTGSDPTTPVGVYTTPPLGITAYPQASGTLSNYAVVSSVGTLTICPAAVSVSTATSAACSSLIAETGAPTTSSSQGTDNPSPAQPQPPAGSTSAPVPQPGPVTVSPVQPISPLPAPISGTGPSSGGSAPSGTGTPASPKSPIGIVPKSGPVTLPPQNGPGQSSGGITPVPEPKPVKTPPQQGSSSTVVPIFLPRPGLPLLPSLLPSLLPHVSVRIGGAHTGSTRTGHDSDLLLFEDGRVRALPEWLAIAVTLECSSATPADAQPVVITQDGVSVATVQVVPGHELETRIPMRTAGAVRLKAYYAGSRTCTQSASKEITVETAEMAALETLNDEDGSLLKFETPRISDAGPKLAAQPSVVIGGDSPDSGYSAERATPCKQSLARPYTHVPPFTFRVFACDVANDTF